ncbi:MAG: pseudouridine synthase [Fervidobacterium sp.]|uniref:pseudouridine synthase n=1 Tax=Fervidobacterium sp. TaxID=1871331 RepID=UPI00404B32B7
MKNVKESIRLDKYLANAKVGTRSEVKKYIKEGRVAVNGRVVYEPEFHVSQNDEITIDGEHVNSHRNVYIMLFKPAGFVSTTSEYEPSVLNLIDHPYIDELHIAGRLDKDVEGLLILTNDGDFTHRLISPRKHVEKEYYIYTKHPYKLTEEVKNEFQKGLEVDGEKFLPAKIEQVDEKTISITIIEGKYHQIKKMCKKTGIEWERILRVRIGRLTLGELKKGEWRELSKEEIDKIFER